MQVLPPSQAPTHAKAAPSKAPKFAKKSDVPWQEAIWLGRDTEADEIVIATPEGARKVRTIGRFSPSLRWKSEPLKTLQALPWKPRLTLPPLMLCTIAAACCCTGYMLMRPRLRSLGPQVQESAVEHILQKLLLVHLAVKL